MPRRTEGLLLAAALVVVALFVGSFVVGLVGGASPGHEEPVAAAGPAPVPPVAEAEARVEVLNAGGRSGAARRATERLRSSGYDVVYYGNASAGVDRSVVLARVAGGEAVARGVAARLGIAEVEMRPDSSLLLDATVLLGPEWPPPEVAAPERGFWARVKDLFR